MNQELYDAIRRDGASAIATWREKHPDEEIDLAGAKLTGADLAGANLAGANLWLADLAGAKLAGANLWLADLAGAKLVGAILAGANLAGANLAGANLAGVVWNYTTIGMAPAPEGTLIGWGKKSGHIVKLEIPAEARRSCATTRKFRAEYARVLEIDDGNLQWLEHHGKNGHAEYVVGEITRADSWDEDRWNECSHGIHFFLSRHEAETWRE